MLVLLTCGAAGFMSGGGRTTKVAAEETTDPEETPVADGAVAPDRDVHGCGAE